MLKRFIYIALIGLFLLPFTAKAASILNIQVSIKPIHGIVAFICQGVLEPGLLMTGQESPHTQALSPKQLQALQQADLVIWIGPEYESRWQQPLRQQVKPEKILSLSQSPGLTLYPYRQQGISCDHEHDHGCHHDHEGHSHSGNDGHIWLDLNNAKVIAQEIAEAIINLDPEHKVLYEKNLSEFLVQLVALESDLKQMLAPIKGKGYFVYHDGLQYFDKYFGFQMTASLVAEPDLPPNAQDLLRLKKLLSETPPEQRPACVFIEPGFNDTFSQNLAAEFNLKRQPIDYIGYDVPQGPQAYFVIMRQLVKDFIEGMS